MKGAINSSKGKDSKQIRAGEGWKRNQTGDESTDTTAKRALAARPTLFNQQRQVGPVF